MRSTPTSTTWMCTAAPYNNATMQLTLVERERITDSVLKIQSVRNSLEQVDEKKLPAKEEIEHCLENADHDLRVALGYGATPAAEKDKCKTSSSITPAPEGAADHE
jgi:hypothetical protein